MVDAFLGVARTSKSGRFMWKAASPFVSTLFDEESPGSLNQVIIFVSPYVLWDEQNSDGHMVTRWAAAVSKVPDTNEVGQSVVDTLLHIASIGFLQPFIPLSVWAWLKKQPPLPPICTG